MSAVGPRLFLSGRFGWCRRRWSRPCSSPSSLAAYGGVFVAGSLAWGIVFDGFRPDRYDLIGAAICIIGVSVIMYAPRTAG